MYWFSCIFSQMLVFVVFVAGQGTEHCSDGHIIQTKVQQLYTNKHQPAAPQARCSKNTLRSLLPVTSSWIWTRCKPTTPAGLWTVWTLKFSRLFRHVQCNDSFSANLKVFVSDYIFYSVYFGLPVLEFSFVTAHHQNCSAAPTRRHFERYHENTQRWQKPT